MNKEEFKSPNEYHKQMRGIGEDKAIQYMYAMSKQIFNLQSQLDIANKKLEEIKKYIENNSLYEEEYDYDYDENIQHTGTNDEKAKRDILSIIGGE